MKMKEPEGNPRNCSQKEQESGPPTLRMRVTRDERVVPGDFSPLAAPREISLELGELSPSLVENLEADLMVELKPGRYLFPLFRDEQLPVDIPEECRCEVRATVARSRLQTDSQARRSTRPGRQERGPRRRGSAAAAHVDSTSGHALRGFSEGGCSDAAARDGRSAAAGGYSQQAPGPDSGETVLTWAEASFDRPVHLGNILVILLRLQQHFADVDVSRVVAAVRSLVEGSQAMKDLGFFGRALLSRLVDEVASFLENAGRWPPDTDRYRDLLAGTVRRAASVTLSRITARPVERHGRLELELRFTGKWLFFDRWEIPFDQVGVPAAILPAPHAELVGLLSNQPLASARIRESEDSPLREMLCELAMSLERFRGQVRCRADSPAVAVDNVMGDGGMLSVTAGFPGPLALEATLSGEVAAPRLSVQLDSATVEIGGARFSTRAGLVVSTRTVPLTPASDSAVARCINALFDRTWTTEDLDLQAFAVLHPGSRLDSLRTTIRYSHPLLTGDTRLDVIFPTLQLHGAVEETFGSSRDRPDRSMDLHFKAVADLVQGSLVDLGDTRLAPSLTGTKLNGTVRSTSDTPLEIKASAGGQALLALELDMQPFPELDIDDAPLTACLAGRFDMGVRLNAAKPSHGTFHVDVAGTTLDVKLANAAAELGARKLVLPAGSRLRVDVAQGVLAVSGLGQAALDLTWDLAGRSPVLSQGNRSVELFVRPLRKGLVTLNITPSGGISVSGPEQGLYDARYFNALLNPLVEPKRILEILSDDEALDRVLATLALFSADLAAHALRLRDFTRRARRIFDEEGIRELADAIPLPRLARLAARLFFDRPDFEPRLLTVIGQVIDGRGLNVRQVKQMVAERYPDHAWEFEVDRLLRLAARLLGPAEPVASPPVRRGVALAESPATLERLSPLPSAAEIYRVAAAPAPLPRAFSETVARLAPCLTLEQVQWLLDRGRPDPDDPGSGFRPVDLARLRHVLEVKRRVRMIAQGYGGVAYAPQATVISFFLAETIHMSRIERPRLEPAPLPYPVPHCLMGPRDVALLLHAGLASAWVGRAVQLNQRLLLDLVLEQPAQFLLDVLVELGNNDPRILTNALMALLDLPQGALRTPLDLPGILSERMGFEFPRIADFLAGGRRARHSYYEAVADAADQILQLGEPYRAFKYFVQEARGPLPAGCDAEAAQPAAVRRARNAITAADAAGTRCDWTARTVPPPARHRTARKIPAPASPTLPVAEVARRNKARTLYQKAFDACAALLRKDPLAFQLPWFKEFWSRNHEALVVLSVVRNVQQGVDRVARWLECRTGEPPRRDEQDLLAQIVHALYHGADDRNRLEGDPLVRLLIDPPEGKYRFTIVSAMGVITYGARGHELEDAFARIEARRGVRIVRADTATARSLEYNAQRIIEAVSRVDGPWGYIGYSQGCANCLMAEHRLMTGTPEQQRMLNRFVGRNLLFSAFNGSAHGTCSDRKFLDAMVFLDHFLSHYQAMLSNRAIQAALAAIRLLLDSRPVILGMAGSRSVSLWGVLPLHQGGVFREQAPTSTVRGVVEPSFLPEALEFLANILTRQNDHDRHDTQVTTDEAQGHSILVETPRSEVLARCDMGSLVQRTHHWSPLLKDVELVTTDRDRERSVYDYPKDRHVFPWVEVNARFGRIERA
ncbi:MAG: hypothetical protein FJ109_11865 [Deltaproteobacteria bacterium]|nr:hypothetical protein [Deltaproteobacteria bacterium]